MKRAWAIGRNGRGMRFRLMGTGLVFGTTFGWSAWVGVGFMAVGLVLELRAGEDG